MMKPVRVSRHAMPPAVGADMDYDEHDDASDDAAVIDTRHMISRHDAQRDASADER